ncbi:MAG: Asp-tRNA(Asn)/Glu-tRNA(Gln) amidotransferase GatCAB subunit B, partial [Minwuiales bacterium]|nr:Asp-tRNA(Asn)/Glu-tRNA(Gln) amidotransferase GatCAB subunit B [Minwuiales bacterium]
SIRFVKQAIEYEARRQVDVLEDGGSIDQETRLYDTDRGVTRAMRTKEEAHDYRYFPDPDLLPLELDPDWVEEIRRGLPELPDQKKARFEEDFGLSAYDAEVLVSEKENADYYERVVATADPKLAANWVITELFGALNKAGRSIDDSPVPAEALAGLIERISDNTISGRIAKEVFEIMFETGRPADAIIEEKGLKQVTDTGAIEAMVDEVIAANPDKVADVKAGKDKLIGWFVGQVMKASQGKANPQMVNDMLKAKLLG